MKPVFIVRQGDVIVQRVSDLPAGATLEKDANKVVLAYGEVTGHHHRFDDVLADPQSPRVRLWSAGAERYIQVLEASALTHEEHAPITLEPGVYKVTIQRQYSPEAIRHVTD
jgi:hypothetical protein